MGWEIWINEFCKNLRNLIIMIIKINENEIILIRIELLIKNAVDTGILKLLKIIVIILIIILLK